MASGQVVSLSPAYARGVGTPWPRTPASLPPWQCWDGCGTPHHEISKAGESRPRTPPFGSGNERARFGHEKGKCHFKRGATHSLDPARHRRSLAVLGQRRMCALWVGLHPWPLSIPDWARPVVPGRFCFRTGLGPLSSRAPPAPTLCPLLRRATPTRSQNAPVLQPLPPSPNGERPPFCVRCSPQLGVPGPRGLVI